jgi:WD40 repeat protein
MLNQLLPDAHRLILEFFDCIAADPSQVYISALPFVPTPSPLRKVYSNHLRNTINILTAHTQWNQCLRTMQAGSDREVHQVTISPDSHTILVACVSRQGKDHIVMAWDRKAGCLKWTNKSVFEEHGTQARLVFLLGGACVAGLMEEGKVLTLDPENGTVNKVVEGFVARILLDRYPSVIDQPLEGVAPSYLRRTTRVLDDQPNTKTIVVLDDRDLKVQATSQVMSECGSLLVYHDGMKTGCVEVWDVQHEELLKVFASHAKGWVLCVACSPDAKYIAGGGNAIEIWDMESGNLISTLRGHSRQVNSIVFSPDGQQLVSGSDDGTIKIWDWTSTHRRTSIGHTLLVTSVSFIPDDHDVKLMSTSWDATIFAWNIVGHPSPNDTSASFLVERYLIGEGQLKSTAGAVSRDGESFAATIEKRTPEDVVYTKIYMWRLKTKDAPMTLTMDDMWHRVALSRDGVLLALACFSGQICIYTICDLRPTAIAYYPQYYSRAGEDIQMAFSDRGTLLVSGMDPCTLSGHQTMKQKKEVSG